MKVLNMVRYKFSKTISLRFYSIIFKIILFGNVLLVLIRHVIKIIVKKFCEYAP